MDTSLATAERDEFGKLPLTDLFRLNKTSSLVNAGINVGLPYNDSAPDLGAFETDGDPSGINDEFIASSFILRQNYPNPFNPSTKFLFTLVNGGVVTLEIFDILGRSAAVVLNAGLNSGDYEIEWNAHELAGGIYFARLKHGDIQKTIKINLIK
jgi:hypothetical protein